MKPTGYSTKPLIEKLGYLPGDTVLLIDAPIDFRKYLETQNIILTNQAPSMWCHVFFTDTKQLQQFCARSDLAGFVSGLWVSWPKRSSRVLSDLSEQSFRDSLLPLGWVDTKVCAIDDVWSGLKFVRRKSQI